MNSYLRIRIAADDGTGRNTGVVVDAAQSPTSGPDQNMDPMDIAIRNIMLAIAPGAEITACEAFSIDQIVISGGAPYKLFQCAGLIISTSTPVVQTIVANDQGGTPAMLVALATPPVGVSTSDWQAFSAFKYDNINAILN